MWLQITQRALFHGETNKQNQSKIKCAAAPGLKTKGKDRGSGNLIRGGAGVLNLSEATWSLCRTSSRGNPTLVFCSSLLTLVENRCLTQHPGDWKMERETGTKPDRRESMHVERHLDTKAGIWDITVTSAHTDSAMWRDEGAELHSSLISHNAANCGGHKVVQKSVPLHTAAIGCQ